MESISKKIIFIILIASFTYSGLGGRVINDGENSIVTTAKTIHGDVYNCVDIYKQPSLKHPALKDPQMKERVDKYLQEALTKMQSKTNNLESLTNQFWINDGCPFGTVPIPRNTREKSSSISNANFNHSLLERVIPLEFAGIVQDATSEKNPYTGASAFISIYGPLVDEAIATKQYSSASIFLENGNNQLQVGWIVSPSVFGDHQTRMYIGWRVKMDDDDKDICFNFQCKGFVQVDNKVPVGIILAQTSIIGHDQIDLYFEVNKHPDGWEFYFGKDNPTLVGYFPSFLFKNGLQNSANRVKFGGQVYAPVSDETTPRMGSGRFVDGVFDQTCYMRNVKVRFLDGSAVPPNQASIAQSRCYLTGSNQFVKDVPFWQYRFLFGGPGGSDKDCHS